MRANYMSGWDRNGRMGEMTPNEMAAAAAASAGRAAAAASAAAGQRGQAQEQAQAVAMQTASDAAAYRHSVQPNHWRTAFILGGVGLGIYFIVRRRRAR